MPTGFQYACAETVEEATKVLNNAIRTARKHGVEVYLTLEGPFAVGVETRLPNPSEEDDEEDLLR